MVSMFTPLMVFRSIVYVADGLLLSSSPLQPLRSLVARRLEENPSKYTKSKESNVISAASNYDIWVIRIPAARPTPGGGGE